MAFTSSGLAPASAMAARTASRAQSCHSCGSCSANPGCGESIPCSVFGKNALPAHLPDRASSSDALTDELPTSIPSKNIIPPESKEALSLATARKQKGNPPRNVFLWRETLLLRLFPLGNLLHILVAATGDVDDQQVVRGKLPGVLDGPGNGVGAFERGKDALPLR